MPCTAPCTTRDRVLGLRRGDLRGLGHREGDERLQRVANLLSSASAPTVVVLEPVTFHAATALTSSERVPPTITVWSALMVFCEPLVIFTVWLAPTEVVELPPTSSVSLLATFLVLLLATVMLVSFWECIMISSDPDLSSIRISLLPAPPGVLAVLMAVRVLPSGRA